MAAVVKEDLSVKEKEEQLQIFSTEDIVANSNSWTLAGDAALLKYLEKTSDSLFEKTAAVQDLLDEVILEAKRTNTRLGNVNNLFLTLANSQFIENRVYDDDLPPCLSVKEENKDKSKNERETEMVSSVKSAIEMGTNLLNTHFHKIEIRPQDFDEDDDPTFRPEPIYEPLDPYVNRALPAVIGTLEFQKWDHIGLREDEELENDAKALGTENDVDETIVVSVSRNEDVPIPKPRVTEVQPANSDSSGMFGGESEDDLFSKHSSEEGGLIEPKIPPVPLPQKITQEDMLKAELSAKLGLVEGAESEHRAAKREPVQQIKPESEDEEDDLFAVPPPLLPRKESSENSFPTVTNTGLFETRNEGIGLFDDEDDDIFAAPTIRRRGKPAVSRDLPHDITGKVQKIDDVVKTAEAKVVSGNKSQDKREKKPAVVNEGGLFGDESDEDDIFAIPAKKTPLGAPVFGGVPVLSGLGDPFPKSESKKQSGSQNKDRLFEDKNNKNENMEEIGIDSESSVRKVEQGDGDLFEDDSDDNDLFSVVQKRNNHKKNHTSKSDSSVSGFKKELPSRSADTGTLFRDEAPNTDGAFLESEPEKNSFPPQDDVDKGDIFAYTAEKDVIIKTKVTEENDLTFASQKSAGLDNKLAKAQRDEMFPSEKSLASQMVAGLRRNLETKQNLSAAKSGYVIQADSEHSNDLTVRDNREKEPFSNCYSPLPSLSKTRARIPSSMRKLPSRRLLGNNQNSEISEVAVDPEFNANRPPESPPPLPAVSPVEENFVYAPENDRVRVFDPLSTDLTESEVLKTKQDRTDAKSLSDKNVIEKPSPVFDEDVEDIFADQESSKLHLPTKKKADTKPKPENSEKRTVTDFDADTEDIFGGVSHSTTAVTKNTQGKSVGSTDLFADSDSEDIFTSSQVVTSRIVSSQDFRKNAAASSTDLFGDSDSDIFGSEILNEKEQSKKEKKTNTGNIEKTVKTFAKTGLFGEDDDSDLDIFK